MELFNSIRDFILLALDSKLYAAVVGATLILVVVEAWRRGSMAQTAWGWVGFTFESGRIPPPQEILDGCHGRIRTLVFRGSLLAKRMRESGLHEGSKIFDNTEKVLSLFFRSVLDGEDVESATQAAKKQAWIVVQAGYTRHCHPALREDLRAWGKEVDKWIDIVNVIGKQAVEDVRKLNAK